MNRYPTEEELNSLIEELEQQELYAPAHLKEAILWKVREKEQPEPMQTGKNTQASFFLYTLKMVAGMAAAIFLVFAVPVNDGNNVLDYHLDNGRDKLSQMSDKVSDIFDVLLQRENLGGYDNEN